MCVECLDSESSAVPEILNYLQVCLPLPAKCPAEAIVNEKEQEFFKNRLLARAVTYLLMDRIYDDPFDDPVSIVLDYAIELHYYEKYEDNEETSYALDVYTSTLSDIRRYLTNLGYGEPPLSRY